MVDPAILEQHRQLQALTAAAGLHDTRDAKRVLEELHKLGFRIAPADAGSARPGQTTTRYHPEMPLPPAHLLAPLFNAVMAVQTAGFSGRIGTPGGCTVDIPDVLPPAPRWWPDNPPAESGA